MRSDTVTIPVVRLHGTIASGGTQFRQNLSLASVAGVLEKAFAFKNAPAVAISVNSPGGSPVQSRLIYRRIRDLASEKNKPVLIFVEDVAASGGYMIALAGDEIVADPSSIVGSIGVISASFGFTELMKKIGIERRVYTAGRNKAVLDPFKPENEEDVERLKQLQLQVHDTFIDLVKQRRGAKLKDEPDLFTGLFWTGQSRPGTRPGRHAGRHALPPQGALRRQDAAQAGVAAARISRPQARLVRHRRAGPGERHRGGRRGRIGRGRRGTCAVGPLRPLTAGGATR